MQENFIKLRHVLWSANEEGSIYLLGSNKHKKEREFGPKKISTLYELPKET